MYGFRLLLLLTTLLLVAASPDVAAGVGVYFVGADAACPFSNIQDAIDAAAAHPGPDFVWLAMNASFTGQHVVITDAERVVIEGGFVDCTDNDIDTALTTVSGAGNDGGAVFEVHGTSASDIYFKNVFITGAQRNGDASGGGIDFYGAGRLTLEQSSVALNAAGYGGGINVNGSEGHAEVDLVHDVLILNNTAATSGGGIRIEGDTRLFALAPQTLIGFNHAPGGYGGGIEVLGSAQADIGSPGYNGGAVIQFNDALYGGGIAALATTSSTYLRLFTIDPQNPVQVVDNSASTTGGGIYLKPLVPVGGAVLCASDFRINGNIAQEGTAIYADNESQYGSDVRLNHMDDVVCMQPDAVSAYGAVPCAPGVECNEINSNIAEDDSGQPTAGSTILMQTAGVFNADRFSMRNNVGDHAVRTVGGGEVDDLLLASDCLLADNVMGHELLDAGPPDGQSTLTLARCTVTHNQLASDFVLRSAGSVTEIADDIIDQPGKSTLNYQGPAGGLNAAYVMTNDAGTLAGGTDIVDGAPIFVDAANGDYHLSRDSLGIDFAPAKAGLDLDGNPRSVDLIDIPNRSGPLDLGAYEIQTQVASCATADTIYCDGFDGQ